MADTAKQPQYLEDFSANGETPKEVLSLKSAFINQYGLPEYEKLVSRSIRKKQAK